MNKARVVWTTNFDSLVEMACNHPSILDRLPRPLGVVGLDQPQKAVDLLRDEQWPVLVKLHGDFYYRRLKNTTAELQTQDSALRHMLSDACARQGIAVIGYSGRDASIMAALTEALHAPQPFPHGLFWFVRSSESPYPAVVELLMRARQKGVQAALVRISTFDELMADLFMPYQDSLPDVRDHVRDLRPLRRPFPVSYSGNGWPVLRSNALRIEEHPATCTLFQATIGSTSDIKKVTAAHPDKLIVLRARRMERFLSQPFFVAEIFTGAPGKYVSVTETVRGFKDIVEGKYDDLPEAAFYMVGNIEEAVEKGKKLASA